MPQERWRRQFQGDGQFNPVPVGGEGFFNPEPTPFPGMGRSFSPSPTPAPRGDNSGAGLVNRTLFDNQSNADWWSTERPLDPISGSAGANRLSGIGAGTQGSYSFGEPTVQIPTSDARYPLDLDNSPSLFGNPSEWWRNGDLAQGAAMENTSSNDGGGIWSGNDTMGEFGGDLSLGTDLYASLESMQFGEDYPGISVPEQPLNLADNTNIPVEPDLLPQEYEWTTSPGDRRFLNAPGSEEPSSEGGDPNEGRISTGGTSMSGFGGNMSLGGNLYTPLGLMNYGGGYPQYTSRGDGLMTGVVTAGGQVDMWGNQIDDVGGRWVDRSDGSGADWVESARGGSSGQGNGTGTAQIPTQGGVPPGMTIVGRDTVTGAPIYQDSQGNLYTTPGTGTRISEGIAGALQRGDYESAYGQSQLSRESAFTMMLANMSPTGILKATAPQSDRGRTQFNPQNGRPNITIEGDQIVRQPGGRTLGRGSDRSDYAGGLG